MSYQLAFEKRDDILLATATGTRSLETVLAITKDIMAACVQNGVKKALVDVRTLEGGLSTLDAYEIPDRHFPILRDRSVITRCAIVDLKESEERYRFFENVAVNRGFVLHIVSEMDKALAWLKR